MKNLKPKIKSSNVDYFQQYQNKLQLPTLNDSLLNIKPDLNELLNTGLANDSLHQYLYQPNNGYGAMGHHFELFKMREHYINNFGFALLSHKLINSLSEQLKDKNVLEVGSGTGFLSYCLQNEGVFVTPLDEKPIQNNQYNFTTCYTDLVISEASEYIKDSFTKNPFDSIIMSWPSYETDFAHNVLKNMKKGQQLYYCGENYGGCTGNDAFFDLLDTKTVLNEKLTEQLHTDSLLWPGLHDSWYVFDIITD